MASKKKVVDLGAERTNRRKEEARMELELLEKEILSRPHLALRAIRQVQDAKKILIEGLKYHEHDGHDMPKRVARNALAALGVKEEDQP